MKRKMCRKSVKIKNQLGFTLLEIVIALSILALIVGVSYSSLTQIMRSKTILDDRRDMQAIANSVFNRLSRELQMAYSGIPVLPERSEDPSKKISSRINMVGVENPIGNGERGDSIRFVALEAGQYLPDGGRHSGVVQIMYRVEPDPDPIDPDNILNWLIREETPIIKPREKAFARAMIFPVTKNLISLEFNYFDPRQEEWFSTWGDGRLTKLPSKVRAKIKLASPQGHTESYTLAVAIRSIN